jgi:hypothetical protein
MIPKKTVTPAIKVKLPFFDGFPVVKRLKKAVIKMVIGINNSTRLAFTVTILKTDKSSASV